MLRLTLIVSVKALYHGKFIDSGFTMPFYKKLLSKKLMLSDIESVDPEMHSSLVWIRLENGEVISSYSCMEREESPSLLSLCSFAFHPVFILCTSILNAGVIHRFKEISLFLSYIIRLFINHYKLKNFVHNQIRMSWLQTAEFSRNHVGHAM